MITLSSASPKRSRIVSACTFMVGHTYMPAAAISPRWPPAMSVTGNSGHRNDQLGPTLSRRPGLVNGRTADEPER